jgi:hypothetical protein
MIISFEGFQGASKTTAAVATTYEQGFKIGRKVICNDHLNFEYTHFSLEWFLEHINDTELEDCVLFLDEFYQIVDSRNSGTKVNKLFSYFMVQTRKRGVDLYYCTHHIENVDVRLRRATDIRGACKFYPEKPCRDCKGAKVIHKNGVDITCPRCNGYGEGGLSFINFLDKRMRKHYFAQYWGPNYWGLFATKERVAMQQKFITGIDTSETV